MKSLIEVLCNIAKALQTRNAIEKEKLAIEKANYELTKNMSDRIHEIDDRLDDHLLRYEADISKISSNMKEFHSEREKLSGQVNTLEKNAKKSWLFKQ